MSIGPIQPQQPSGREHKKHTPSKDSSLTKFISSLFGGAPETSKKHPSTAITYGALKRLDIPIIKDLIQSMTSNIQESAPVSPQDLEKIKRAPGLQEYLNREGEENPLIQAIKKNDIQLIAFFLSCGANPNICDSKGCSALYLAVSQQRHEIVQLLLRHKANPNMPNKEELGRLPLYQAAILKDINMLTLLLDGGADIKKQEQNHILLSMDPATLKFLIARGANVNATDSHGETLLHYAVKQHKKEIVAILLNNGANPNLANMDKKTPFHYAINSHNEEYDLVKSLVDHGARCDLADNVGATPLDHAMYYHHNQSIDLFIQRKVNPNYININGQSLLNYAVSQQNIPMATQLLKNGANPNLIDKEGCLPLTLVNNKEIEKLLMKYGADPLLEEAIKGIKTLSQICGVKGNANIKNRQGDQVQTVFLEGLQFKDAMQILSESVKTLFSHKESKLSKEEKAKITYVLDNPIKAIPTDLLHYSITQTADPSIVKKSTEALSRLKKGLPVVILGGTTHHAVSIIIDKNKIMIGNRGEGAEQHGVTVYEWPNDVSDEFMLHILQQFLIEYSSMGEFNGMVHRIASNWEKQFNTQLKQTLYPKKKQEIGNCTSASSKAAFYALLRLFLPKEGADTLYKETTQFEREQKLQAYADLFERKENPVPQEYYATETVTEIVNKCVQKYGPGFKVPASMRKFIKNTPSA